MILDMMGKIGFKISGQAKPTQKGEVHTRRIEAKNGYVLLF
jgi:hypothetical protein